MVNDGSKTREMGSSPKPTTATSSGILRPRAFNPAEDAEGDHVVAAEDGGKASAPLEYPRGSSEAVLQRVIAVDDLILGELESVADHEFPEGIGTQPAVAIDFLAVDKQDILCAPDP